MTIVKYPARSDDGHARSFRSTLRTVPAVEVPPPVNDRPICFQDSPEAQPNNHVEWFVRAHALPATDEPAPARIIMETMQLEADTLRTEIVRSVPGQTLVIMGAIGDAVERPVRLELSGALADLLLAYVARVFVQREAGRPPIPGVYCEELPARYPGSRLFRLAQFAAEGFYRDHCLGLAGDSPTILRPWLSVEWLARECRAQDASLDYHAPCWAIDSRFRSTPNYRLYSDDYRLIGPPIGRRIAVIRRRASGHPRRVAEHRPTDEPVHDFSIQSAQHPDHGHLIEITNGPGAVTAILPYWITEDGRVMIALAHPVARGLANPVPRDTPNLDHRFWSGVMIEPFILETEAAVAFAEEPNAWAKAVLGADLAIHDAVIHGPALYPDPAMLDLVVQPVYLRLEPTVRGGSTHRWHDAQHVLDALAVGLIPHMELESMLSDLLRTLGVPYLSWADCPLILAREQPKKVTSIPELAALHDEKKRRFEFRRGGYGYLTPQRSLFIHDDPDHTHLAAADHVTTKEATANRAVIIPLSLDLNGDVLAGLCLDALPVPDRYGKTGMMMHCPSLPLPADVRTMDDAARHIAAKLNIKQENVAPLGPSSYVALGMTDQRIYPFAVTAVAKLRWHPLGTSTYAPLEGLFALCWPSWSTSFLRRIHEAYASFMSTSDVGMGWGFAKRIDPRQPRTVSTRAEWLEASSDTSQRREPS